MELLPDLVERKEKTGDREKHVRVTRFATFSDGKRRGEKIPNYWSYERIQDRLFRRKRQALPGEKDRILPGREREKRKEYRRRRERARPAMQEKEVEHRSSSPV